MPLFMLASLACNVSAQEGVILLHGLCRTAASLSVMEKFLRREGYVVLNVGYPSRTDTVEHLSDAAIGAALASATLKDCTRIHFVTHSLGGILVRSYFSRKTDPRLGRVVMLGPPNRGSEVVDRLGGWWLFRRLNGPAGSELGTGPSSTPNRLGPVGFELGIIAGDRSINWINSLLIPGADDGKVSVERTQVEGMKEHLVLHATHTFMMRNTKVLRYTLNFLHAGSFKRE
jgi:pimeloyl-ACP methyl ester carboxylesterase